MDDSDFDESELFATFDDVDSSNKNVVNLKSPRKKSMESMDDTEMEVLKNENKQLKKVLRRIASSRQSNESPLASIVYFDRRHGNPANIEEFIKHFAKNREKREVDELSNVEVLSEKHSYFCDGFALALDRYSGGSGQENDEILKYNIPSGSVQYFSSYCLDNFGSNVVDLSTGERYNYEQVYFNILPNNGQGHGKARRANSMCFNCDGDHKLQDCPKPRNLVRIGAKRQEFMANFSSPFVQEARYHANKEKQLKFQHLVPGKMSLELRKALGVAANDLPPFIYRMRMLGYPPGWLPSNHDSGIVIHGKEGETEETNGEEKSLDHEKFMQFPGFNVPVPKDMKDLSNEARLPRMDPRHQLPRATAETTSSLKHRLSSEEYDDHRDSKRRRSTDMDIDDISDDDGTITSQSDNPRTPMSSTRSPSLLANFPHRTPVSTDLEDGEIPDSPSIQRTDANSKGVPEMSKDDKVKQIWWFEEPLEFSGVKRDSELVPPPFPLRPLPLHKISQILPGEMNHISCEDRNLWLDPIFGNLQIRTGRYDRLKTILACRDNKKK